MPNYPCDFEIPDDWLIGAEFLDFKPIGAAYRSKADVVLIPLREITPPRRALTSTNDWHGFDRTRLIDVLNGIVAGDEIPPVPVIQLPESDRLVQLPYRYCIRNGFHRFYASIAAGFECLPATVESLEHVFETSKSLGWRE